MPASLNSSDQNFKWYVRDNIFIHYFIEPFVAIVFIVLVWTLQKLHAINFQLL